MHELTEREQEILKLREIEKLSFQAIADKYGVHKSRAAKIFVDADRKRRANYQLEREKEHNQEIVTLHIARGELLAISNFLWEYTELLSRSIRHTQSELDRLLSDPRYRDAHRLAQQLMEFAKDAKAEPNTEQKEK